MKSKGLTVFTNVGHIDRTVFTSGVLKAGSQVAFPVFKTDL